jgi:hypothetical protein
MDVKVFVDKLHQLKDLLVAKDWWAAWVLAVELFGAFQQQDGSFPRGACDPVLCANLDTLSIDELTMKIEAELPMSTDEGRRGPLLIVLKPLIAAALKRLIEQLIK